MLVYVTPKQIMKKRLFILLDDKERFFKRKYPASKYYIIKKSDIEARIPKHFRTMMLSKKNAIEFVLDWDVTTEIINNKYRKGDNDG